MFYKDLTPYEHLSTNPCEPLYFAYKAMQNRVLNVGWLDDGCSFATGPVKTETLEKLIELSFASVNAYRGVHFCSFCSYEDPPIIECQGKRMRLGNAEIWVPGKDGIVYAAPNLICHYIRDHSYLPPTEFLLAVDDLIEKDRCRSMESAG